jgi:hypothetical protein
MRPFATFALAFVLSLFVTLSMAVAMAQVFKADFEFLFALTAALAFSFVSAVVLSATAGAAPSIEPVDRSALYLLSGLAVIAVGLSVWALSRPKLDGLGLVMLQFVVPGAAAVVVQWTTIRLRFRPAPPSATA